MPFTIILIVSRSATCLYLASKTVRVAVDWALEQAECQCVTATGLTNLVARFLPRHGYQAGIEQEAETLATRLIAYIETRSHDPGPSATEHDRLTDRLR